MAEAQSRCELNGRTNHSFTGAGIVIFPNPGRKSVEFCVKCGETVEEGRPLHQHIASYIKEARSAGADLNFLDLEQIGMFFPI